MACSPPTSSSSSSSQSTDTEACWDWRKALSAEMKLFRGLAFAFTLAFTLLLFLSFYLFYLRLRRLRRTPPWSVQQPEPPSSASNALSAEQVELGVKKELREMLPVVVFKESFSVTDTICSVCLGDYQAEDRLQQIPACKHAFHVECIDNWLSTHTTCPLCRLSLLASSPTEPQPTNDTVTTHPESSTDASLQIDNCDQSSVDPVRQ
ncbi:putative transcription factor C2H2 family [Helianthus annuus]|uniref:RING-type E3 ubiquitin transferase n=1 Tax=Helianthus annuus TaxID=4232 RepID=A0A251US77_HELAN|nr:RING-H2 finger protein ATL58 isoform X1 [Helianthus annuus]KAF5806418.1 putative transcription factor C2H2 family [Helianthus annuus]KAJ0570689.1 putative transcription factor C2H2 family [Helianthus annuus]KAJ0585032.1 putative transcription factor C2H2 family [Helianthus annuus]KAJ0747593.1 putative transcription factor C2H2 family [Helianthus annuus]KAJ0919475.1 putative transcription factor C2H2 family [Helianthus annuus]